MTDGSLPGDSILPPVSPAEVICDSCGSPYYSFIIINNEKKITLNCPHCGEVVFYPESSEKGTTST